MGVATLVDNTISLLTVSGTPVQQFQYLVDTYSLNEVLIEDFTYFNAPNPKTTSLFIQRFGYIYWRLYEQGANIRLCHVGTVRKSLGVVSTKKGQAKIEVWQKLVEFSSVQKMTKDEADALALLLFSKQMKPSDLSEYNVKRYATISYPEVR